MFNFPFDHCQVNSACLMFKFQYPKWQGERALIICRLIYVHFLDTFQSLTRVNFLLMRLRVC